MKRFYQNASDEFIFESEGKEISLVPIQTKIEIRYNGDIATAAGLVLIHAGETLLNNVPVTEVMKDNASTPHDVTSLRALRAIISSKCFFDEASVMGATYASAEMYLEEGAVAASIPNGTTYTKLVVYEAIDDVDNTTPSLVTGDITIITAGKYRVFGKISGTVNNSCTVFPVLFKTSGASQTELHQTHGELRYGSTSDYNSIPLGGIIDLAVGDKIDMRIRHSNGSAITFTSRYASLGLYLIKKA